MRLAFKFLFPWLLLAVSFGAPEDAEWRNDDRDFWDSGETSREKNGRVLEDKKERTALNKVVLKDSDCHLGGYWYNMHGSELLLNVSADGKLTGEFRTAVESSRGAAGHSFAQVTGETKKGLFSFQAFWAGGESVTTWTGQCHRECDHGSLRDLSRKPMLHTTWVLTTNSASCDDHWMANRIGQDMFTRKQLKVGPRKAQDTHHPVRSA